VRKRESRRRIGRSGEEYPSGKPKKIGKRKKGMSNLRIIGEKGRPGSRMSQFQYETATDLGDAPAE
jgi:hypothetical protein